MRRRRGKNHSGFVENLHAGPWQEMKNVLLGVKTHAVPQPSLEHGLAETRFNYKFHCTALLWDLIGHLKCDSRFCPPLSTYQHT